MVDIICDKCNTLVPYETEFIKDKKVKGKKVGCVECFGCLSWIPVQVQEPITDKQENTESE